MKTTKLILAKRRSVPESVQSKLVTACRRRCCLCVYLNDDRSVKAGQIAHIDRDSSNSNISNLAWLCLEHHDQYDSRTSQSKGMIPGELIKYKSALENECRSESMLEPNERLRVRIRPEWSGLKWAIHIHVESRVTQPIKVGSIGIRLNQSGEPVYSTSIVPGGAFVLAPFGERQFSFVIKDAEPLDIAELYLIDSDNVDYYAPPEQIELIHQFNDEWRKIRDKYNPALENQTALCADDFDTRVDAIIEEHKPLALAIEVVNRSGQGLAVYACEFGWEADPEKHINKVPKVRYQKLGANVVVNIPEVLIKPNDTTRVIVQTYVTDFARDCAAHDVDGDKSSIGLHLTNGWMLRITEDGLPEALAAILMEALKRS